MLHKLGSDTHSGAQWFRVMEEDQEFAYTVSDWMSSLYGWKKISYMDLGGIPVKFQNDFCKNAFVSLIQTHTK